MGKIFEPADKLIFRQQLKKRGTAHVCSVTGCEMPRAGQQNYCFMHIKTNLKQAQTIINEMQEQLGKDWPAFIKLVQEEAQKEVANKVDEADGASIKLDIVA